MEWDWDALVLGCTSGLLRSQARRRLVDHTGYLRAFLMPKANPLRSGAIAVHTQLIGFRLSLAE
jgi:hypothetical protein